MRTFHPTQLNRIQKEAIPENILHSPYNDSSQIQTPKQTSNIQGIVAVDASQKYHSKNYKNI